MNDDDLLHALAGEVREERDRERARLDERWDRLAAGELSAAGEAELRALAAESAAAREAYEAFRPLGEDFRKRVVQAIQAESGAAAEPRDAPMPWDASVPRPGRILRWDRRAAAWFGGALASAATLAASLFFLVGIHPPLPVYELVKVTGGEARWRGGPATAATPQAPAAYLLHPGSRLGIEARPTTPVAGPIEARWFAAREGEAPHELPAPAREVSKSGAVRLAGTLGQDLDLDPGLWSLWVMVGRPGELPDASVLRSRGAGAAGWTLRQMDGIVWRAAQLRVETRDAGR
jgi:hypothetical protein